MTAADKLRELLATRPAMPNTEELVRWWRSGGALLYDLLAEVEAVDCDLVAERAELRRERDARAALRVELDRAQREKAEMVSDLVCADRNRAGDTAAPAERDAEIVKLRAELAEARMLARDAQLQAMDRGASFQALAAQLETLQLAAPVMLTVMALLADEADVEGLREVVLWYYDREPDHLNIWLDAERARNPVKPPAAAASGARREPA